ncbi:MAG: hypothetical protein M3Y77_21330 [Actinomycetota bacterium]|nr:hypothetical protein [Actinomycetota bacterium]
MAATTIDLPNPQPVATGAWISWVIDRFTAYMASPAMIEARLVSSTGRRRVLVMFTSGSCLRFSNRAQITTMTRPAAINALPRIAPPPFAGHRQPVQQADQCGGQPDGADGVESAATADGGARHYPQHSAQQQHSDQGWVARRNPM